MRRLGEQWWLAMLLSGLLGGTAQAQDFSDWLTQFRMDAMKQGISEHTLDNALGNIEVDETVIKLDQKQPETQITLEKYLSNTVTPRRIRLGREAMQESGDMLRDIGKRYGVQPQYIVALWGIETDYGNYTGNFSVVQSLATLAYEGRRADFFRTELVNALRIIETEGIAPEEMIGSWAGAMGNCQFMPSTYLKYAVDYDRDGKKDVWTTPGDNFASIANYLHGLGWNKNIAALDQGTPTANYNALLQWNRSRYFATAVSTLAEQIAE